MTYLIIGVFMDLVVVAAGVAALAFAGRSARARVIIRLAGIVLILNSLVSTAWRVWTWYVFEFQGLPTDPTQEPLFELHRTLVPVRSLVGTVTLVTAIVLLVVALALRGRHEFGVAQFHAVAGGGHSTGDHWGAEPQATDPRHGALGPPPPGGSPRWDQGGHRGHNPGTAWNPSSSGDWRPAPGTEPQQPPPHPPEDPPAR